MSAENTNVRTNEDIRNDFVLIAQNEYAYLDNAATSQKPVCVIDAEKRFYTDMNANPMRGFYPLSLEATKAYEDARSCVANFIGASCPEEIVFTRNATESINLVAYSWGLNNIRACDEIAVSVSEHHSNMLPWQMVSKATGAKLNYIECKSDGSYSDEELERAINSRTKLVAITHVSNVLGRRNPIEKITEMAHSFGALVLVDASQSIPHMKIDVQKLGADFLAFSGHKLLAPMGIGALYGRKSLLEDMPPFLTGGEMIESVRLDGATYAEVPHKFEAGTVNAAGAYALSEAIRYINSIGYEYIKERDRVLTAKAIEALRKTEHVRILGSEDSYDHNGIISFTIDNVHPHDISEVLAQDKVCIRAGHHCAQPLMEHLKIGSCARASIMFYNSEDEVERFIESVASVRRRLGWA